jgi:hypothetical protein
MIAILTHQMHMSIIYFSSVMVRPKQLEIRNVMTVKIPKTPKKTAVRRSQICRRKRDIILRFEINSYNLICSGKLKFKFVLSSKHKYRTLSYCAVETFGDLQSTSRRLNPVVKSKIHDTSFDAPDAHFDN